MRLVRPASLPRALLVLLLAAMLAHLAPACGGGGGNDGGQRATIAFLTTDSSGDESATPARLTVELSEPLASDSASVDVAVTGGTATAGEDFALSATSLTIPAGQTQGTVDLAVTQDGFDEPNETVELTLSNPRSGGVAALTLGAARTHVYTLRAQSASAQPTLSLRASALSVDEGIGSTSLVVHLSQAAAGTVTVDYALAGGTATAGTDFSFTPGTLTFPSGSLTQVIPVQIADDPADEDSETVRVTLSNPSGAQVGGPATATLTIANNDPAPSIGFTSSNVSADESDGAAQLGVSLSTPSGRDVTVSYGPSGGTATGSGVDYALSPGTLTIPAGQTAASIPVTVTEDADVEGNESVTVSLSNPINATLGNVAQGSLTIVDNDGLPLVGFATATSSALENSVTANISVTLSAASSSNVQVSYTVTGGTATRETDYRLADGVVIFTPSQTTRTIQVNLLGDAIDEDDETVVVTLSTPVNAGLGARSTHTFSLTDDDVSPSLTFSGSSFTPNESNTAETIIVRLTGATARTVTVNYGVTGGTATGGGTDFTLPTGSFTFAPGETSKDLIIPLVNDALDEDNETVVIALSSPGNAVLGSPSSTTLTITDDDALPTVAFVDASSSSSEGVANPSIPVRLSAASGREVRVSYAVGAGSTATGGGTDYTLTTGALIFPAGTTQLDVPISVAGDTSDEPNETVVINLAGPQNAALGGTGSHTFTINDDDPAPTVQFSAATSAGPENTTAVSLTVTLSSSSSQSVTVAYSVTGGTATSADYANTSGTLTFPAGTTSRPLGFSVVNDPNDEDSETVIFTLASPTNATLGTQTTHTYTILNNDLPPTVQFLQATTSQLESVTSPAITVTLSLASGRQVSVPFSVTGGTATSPGDYSLGASPLSFPAGTTSLSLPLTVVNDSTNEPNETISFQLGTPTNASLGTQQTHTFTILNND